MQAFLYHTAMKKEIKKTRIEIRLDKQAEKLRENLKKRKAWQEAYDKLQINEDKSDDAKDKG